MRMLVANRSGLSRMNHDTDENDAEQLGDCQGLASEGEESQGLIHNNITQEEPGFYWSSVALIVAVPLSGDFLFGMDIGLTSFSVQGWETTVHGDVWKIGWLLSATSTGAFLASFFIFQIADRIGRRQELRLAAVSFLLGGLLQVLSSLVCGTIPCWLILLVGRWVYGVGVAFALHAATAYIGEMAPLSIKGPLMSLNEMALLIGLLAGYIIGVVTGEKRWGALYIPTLIFSSTMAYLSFHRIPESYRWLLAKSRLDDAQLSCQFLYKSPLLMREEHASSNSLTAEQQSSTNSLSEASVLLQRKYRRAIRAAIGVVAFLQLTGQPTLLAYASPLFESAGLHGSFTVWVGIWKLLLTLVVISVVEKQGRRRLLLIGCSIMLLALFSLLLCSWLSLNGYTKSISVLLCICLYVGGYQIGFGTMVWLVTLEVTPMAIRGPVIALGVQTNFGMHALMEFLVPLLQQRLGLDAVLGMFALNTTLALIFVHVCVPETKGMSLEEIEEKLTRERF